MTLPRPFRDVLPLSALLLAVALGGTTRGDDAEKQGGPLSLGPEPFEGQPNIVLIMADDNGCM